MRRLIVMIDDAVINRIGDLLDNQRRSLAARHQPPSDQRMFHVALLLFQCVRELRSAVARLEAVEAAEREA